MTGSFTKRAKALAMFAGLLPLTAAQAQEVVPKCEFILALSKTTKITGDLFTQDENPAIRGNFHILVEAAKVKPDNKQLLVSPTAAVAAAYDWSPAGTFRSYSLEVLNPYTVAEGQTGPDIASALTVEGSAETFTMETQSFNLWHALAIPGTADLFGTLKKDVTLAIGAPAGNPGAQSYVFTFPKADFVKGYKAGPAQFTALLKKQQAGSCQPKKQLSTAPGGDAAGCFLTTATCEAVGLTDDCWELRTLRTFRDGWLADQADGVGDIAAYYAKAPAIAERLKSDPQALLRLYWTRIVPSALAAQVGANKIARAIYSKGMRELAYG